MFYAVNNWYESYMIFSNIEKAFKVVEILRKEYADNLKLNIDTFDKICIFRNGEDIPHSFKECDLYKNYYIIELKEGQGFGSRLSVLGFGSQLSVLDKFAFVEE